MGEILTSGSRSPLTLSGNALDRSAPRAPYRTLAGLVVFALFGVTVISLAAPGSLAVQHSHIFNIAITTASLLVALGAAFFLVTDFLLYGRLSSFYVGYAFLVFAGASAGSGLLPLLMGWDRQMHFVPYGWALQRAVGATFLFAAAILVDRDVSLGRRRRLVALGVALTFALVISGTLGIYLANGSAVPQGFQTVLQMVSCVLLFSASVLFWRTSRQGQASPWFVWLSICLTVAGFAELQYAFHPYQPLTAQLGDILRLLFYTGLLLALGMEWSRGYKRLHLQARELETLHALMTPPSVQDVQGVIRHVVDVVGQALNTNARVVVNERDASHRENLTATRALTDERAGVDSKDARRIVVAFDDGHEGTAAFGVPLTAGSSRLGMLVVDRGPEGEFDDEDLRLLRSFGAQASVLLERSLLYEEVAAGAVLEERSRLAREIHDGLAQHLAFLKMRVAWLQRSPANLELSHLVDIEGVLETALTEARQAITTLRTAPSGSSTADAIAAYAADFGQVSGLSVQAEREGHVPEVGPKARVELLRIVQEALNNVRKHARARHVTVRILSQDGDLLVIVRDDGAGFIVGEDLRGHFGIDIMSERAQSIGGHLEVTSEPRAGTEVRISVPAGEAEPLSSGSQTA
ncbi:MAG TPA: histidine kinase [Chloroflexota bacterium]